MLLNIRMNYYKVQLFRIFQADYHIMQKNSYKTSFYCHNGAGDENRTHVVSLEGWGSTIELHPQIK